MTVSMTEERWAVIVDNRPLQAQDIAKVVAQWGLPSKGFTDPEDALRFAREHRGSVVFAMFDVFLGEKSGVDYARTFRKEQLSHDIALMTVYPGNITDASSQELLDLGVAVYEKPIDFKRLHQQIVAWCRDTPSLPGENRPAGQPVRTTIIENGPSTKSGYKKILRRAVIVAAMIVVATIALPRVMVIFRAGSVPVLKSHFVGESGKNKKLVVFVHGVFGDMDGTWVNPDNHASWPGLLRNDPHFNEFDVFVYGYSSPYLGQASDIDQIAQRLGQQLTDLKMFSQYEEISFITHSMGGIVTKRMLNMLNTPSENAKLRKVHCVIFLAVPSNGADAAALASWISLNPQLKSMSPEGAAIFLRTVEGDWAALLRGRPAASLFLQTFSAYETLPTHGVTVVPALYISQLSDGRIVAFDYNHIDIVKPHDRGSDVYFWAAARISECSGSPK